MRIAKLYMDPQDKTKFEIQGKSSVKYHLKANHIVETKRWFWALNNAIQWTKDEAREEERRKNKDAELLRHAKLEQIERQNRYTEESGAATSYSIGKPGGKGVGAMTATGTSSRGPGLVVDPQGSSLDPRTAILDDGGSAYGSYEPSLIGNDMTKTVSNMGTATIEGDFDEEQDDVDDASVHEIKPTSKDAFNITAQSARLQLDMLTQVMSALQVERSKNPGMTISDPTIVQVTSAYDSAVRSFRDILGDLLKISRDRDAYWQYRLNREINIRRLWEDSMAKVAREQEILESRIGESEDKRKRTKKALRQALEGSSAINSRPGSRGMSQSHDQISEVLSSLQLSNDGKASLRRESVGGRETGRKKSVITELTSISDSESDDDEEFFDAVDAGEVEVVAEMPATTTNSTPLVKDGQVPIKDLREAAKSQITASFAGYQDPVRKRLKMEADDRPKISLWVS